MGQNCFTSQTIKAGLSNYVTLKLEADPYYFDSRTDEPPLWLSMATDGWRPNHMSIIINCFKLAKMPMQSMPGLLSWQLFMQQACYGDGRDFCIALRASTFSDFLEHGAGRNARVPAGAKSSHKGRREATDGESPDSGSAEHQLFVVSRFVEAMFTCRSSHALFEQCLGLLRDFLHYEDSSELKLQVQGLSEVLTAQITKLASLGRSNGAERIRFLGRVTDTVINVGIGVGIEMRDLKKVILDVFPTRLGETLTGLIPSSEPAPHLRSGRSTGKRSGLQAAGSNLPRKRSRRR